MVPVDEADPTDETHPVDEVDGADRLRASVPTAPRPASNRVSRLPTSMRIAGAGTDHGIGEWVEEIVVEIEINAPADADRAVVVPAGRVAA